MAFSVKIIAHKRGFAYKRFKNNDLRLHTFFAVISARVVLISE